MIAALRRATLEFFFSAAQASEIVQIIPLLYAPATTCTRLASPALVEI